MSEEILSLHELNALVRRVLDESLPESCWIRAELSDVRHNANGHCYLEFVQKDERNGQLIAKARGMIWNQTFALLKPYFEESTGQTFGNGLKVLVEVSVQFHELYGFSLTVHNIDPTYTVGDMARRRLEIIRQLEEEGVLTLNKELEMPMLPQRIAVISSSTAAGYEDFCHQLQNNAYDFAFQTVLFPAYMQGAQVEESILNALHLIYDRMEEFDVVVIIRGGGATSELSCFDSYLLAAACAQFDLPIIVGIGHERDETVLDAVANVRAKTPTAAAEYLIGRAYDAAARLSLLSSRIHQGVSERITNEFSRLERFRHRLPSVVIRRLAAEKTRVVMTAGELQRSSKALLLRQNHRLELLKQRVSDASPQRLLAKGYSITLCNGKAVKDVSLLNEGDEISTRVWKGELNSIITTKKLD